MKQIFRIWIGCLFLIATTACEKDTLAEGVAPEVTTGTATSIYRKGATLSGSIRLTGTMAVERYGFLFSELQSMAEYREIPISSGATDYSIAMQDLEPGKTYYFCSYAHSGYSIVRGEVRSFTTSESNAPVFDVPIVSDESDRTFTITAALLDDGGSELMLSGFCHNEEGSKAPTFMDNVTNVELSGNAITATISGLIPGKTYQVRAYGASNNGLAYSELVRVTTGEAVVPYLSEVVAYDSTSHRVTVSSRVLEAGSAEVTEVGFCYSSTNQNPTTNDITIPVHSHTDSFEAVVDNISSGTTYYIRAYAVNEYGTGYSDVLSIITPEEDSPEKELLMTLYESTNGDNWTINTNWNSNKPLNEWYGVKTDDLGLIISIELPNNNLTGTASICFDDYSNLAKIDFDNNKMDMLYIEGNDKIDSICLNNPSIGQIHFENFKYVDILCDSLTALNGNCESLKVSGCDFGSTKNPFSGIQTKDAIIYNCKMHSCGLNSETLIFESSSTYDTWYCITSKRLDIIDSYCSTICSGDFNYETVINLQNATLWRSNWDEESNITLTCTITGEEWYSLFLTESEGWEGEIPEGE